MSTTRLTKGMRILALISMLGGITYSAHAAEWWEKVKLSGDLRYRHESSQDNIDYRDIQRIRARIYAAGQVNENVNAILGIVASTSAISANVSEGDSFSRKPLGLELAYIEYKAIPELCLYLGKMKNFFERPGGSQLMWNVDLNPEGIGGAASTDVMKDLKVYLNGAGYWITENAKALDTMMYVGQVGIKTSVENLVKINVGGGYQFYQNIVGAAVFVDSTKTYGNSALKVVNPTTGVVTNYYTKEYKVAEGFLDISTDAAGTPLRLFADYVVNGEMKEDYRAYLVGLTVSKCKDLYSWDLAYNYRWVEKDAVVGAFADAHHGGGQTNAFGHNVTLSFMPLANLKTSLNYYMDWKNIVDPTFFKRLQVDIQTTF
jgi:hypothetical protein